MKKGWFHVCIIDFLFTLGIFFSLFDKSFFFTFPSPLEEGSQYEVGFMFDSITGYFFVMACVISILVLKYSYKYMDISIYYNKFHLTLFLFIISMLLLSASTSLFWSMIGWDGLGLSSFLLIIFFQSWKSFNSGMMTFMYNRAGDLFLISCICMSLKWNPAVSWSWKANSFYILSILLLIGSISKSAQSPFSSWLPQAMAAPTPVSSLVHSSTLVTAGIFISVRFFHYFSDTSFFFLSLISLCTIFLAGFSSLKEMDLKKIIALSTLSHIGFIFFFISVGAWKASMVHMLAHAFFKSLLFMSGGQIIHLDSKSSQDIRRLSYKVRSDPFLWMVFVISIMSMMGIPFLSGFLSKEFFLVSVEYSSLSHSWMIQVGFYNAIFLTSAYSARLVSILTWKSGRNPMYYSEYSIKFFTPFLVGLILAVAGGSWVSGFILPIGLAPPSFLEGKYKILMFLALISGTYIGYYASWIRSGGTFLYLMWYVSSFGLFWQKFIFTISYFLLSKSDSKGKIDWLAKWKGSFLRFFSDLNLKFVKDIPVAIYASYVSFIISYMIHHVSWLEKLFYMTL